ncbi:uncharacterized protein LOC141908351 [Tubulanus polymorphus]|uniref:uncharacterized protein LOC141908351 n=1 Tax=Tubulanus polymorphus TaxID=672921 RepID=UPI003DA531A5
MDLNSYRPTRNIDGLPEQFVKSLRMLFDILDEKNTGFIKLTDIQLYWHGNEEGLPEGVLDSLRQITPRSGKLSFDRFVTGLKIALLKTNYIRNEKSPVKKSRPKSYSSDSEGAPNNPKKAAAESGEQRQPSSNQLRSSPRKNPTATATVHPQQGQPGPTEPQRATSTNNHQPVYRSEKKFVLQGFPRSDQQQHQQQLPQREPTIIKRQRTQSDPTILDSSEIRNASGNFDINFPLPGDRYLQNKLPSKFFPTPAPLRASQDDNAIRRGGAHRSPTKISGSGPAAADSTKFQRNSVSDIPYGTGSSRFQQPNYSNTAPGQTFENVHGRTNSVLSTGSARNFTQTQQQQQQQDRSVFRDRSQSELTTAQDYKRSSYHENISPPPSKPDATNIRQSRSDSQLRGSGRTTTENKPNYRQHSAGNIRAANTSPVRPENSQSTSPVHKVAYKKMREPRRHTLQNGVDFNFVKKMKQLEQERDILIQGLQVVEEARDWYKHQITNVQERQQTLSKNQQLELPFSIEAQQERMTFQTAQIEEVNQKLICLIRSSEKGFGFHVDIPSASLTNAELIKQFNQDLSEQASRILKLEQEKSSLIKELFEAKAKITPPSEDNTFYD